MYRWSILILKRNEMKSLLFRVAIDISVKARN